MKPTVITVGEPAGIGPDCVILACECQPELFDHCIIAAPASWLKQRASMMNRTVTIHEYDNLDAAAPHASPGELHCWNPLSTQPSGPVSPGHPSAATATAVIHCIEAAALACLRSEAASIVTGPIEKAVLRSAGFDFPGHTEFLAWLAAASELQPASQPQSGPKTGERTVSDFVMMLASDQIRVALLTTHMAMRDVPDALDVKKTLQCLHIVNHDLRSRFGIATPKLALCALNPHAGEQGHFGREEINILEPAAQLARDQGVTVSKPLPADTVFSAAMREQYDAIVCCYHDQALIPIKALSFGEAVNVTLGLPFIRTSVDHGTALDRVGQSSVSCSSMIAAIRMADRMHTRL